MAYTDKQKEKQYRAEYQQRPDVKAKRAELRKQRVIRNKKLVMDNMTPCVACGEDDPVVIDFHHLDMKEKEHGISKLVQNNSSVETLQEELDKCVCLCSNCHRRVHAGTLTLRM